MKTDLSIVEMVMNASVLVQIVMIILLLASLISWTMIFRKRALIRRATRAADQFEEQFWSGGDLVSMFNRINSTNDRPSSLERIFQAGFKEFAKLRNHTGIEPGALVEGSQRAMKVSLSRELDDMEENLSFLATVGSVSPYVGLFGTVWGIMDSFRALGNVHQATLAMVAPGISEALIATAMGLFAAIPAVIAYNRYANQIERLHSRYDAFVEEFSTILQRQSHVQPAPRAAAR